MNANRQYINTNEKPKYPAELVKMIDDNINVLNDSDEIPSIYLFATSLIDADTKLPILKLGYSKRSLSRKNQLESDYKCLFFPINIITNKPQKDEKNMHNYLRTSMANIVFSCEINGTTRTETYVYNQSLIDYYNKCKIDTETEIRPKYKTNETYKIHKTNKTHKPNKTNINNIKKTKTIAIMLYACENCGTTMTSIKSLIRHKKEYCYKSPQIVNPKTLAELDLLKTENISLKNKIDSLKSRVIELTTIKPQVNTNTNSNNNNNNAINNNGINIINNNINNYTVTINYLNKEQTLPIFKFNSQTFSGDTRENITDNTEDDVIDYNKIIMTEFQKLLDDDNKNIHPYISAKLKVLEDNSKTATCMFKPIFFTDDDIEYDYIEDATDYYDFIDHIVACAYGKIKTNDPINQNVWNIGMIQPVFVIRLKSDDKNEIFWHIDDKNEYINEYILDPLMDFVISKHKNSKITNDVHIKLGKNIKKKRLYTSILSIFAKRSMFTKDMMQ